MERASNVQLLCVYPKDDLTRSIKPRAIVKKAQIPEDSKEQLPLPGLLPMLQREHRHLPCLCVVLLQYCSSKEGAPEGCCHGPKDHWLPNPLFTGTVQLLLSEEGSGNT